MDPLPDVDLSEAALRRIEMEARRLRAEAAADGLAALWRALTALPAALRPGRAAVRA